jgi:hypothetical protein
LSSNTAIGLKSLGSYTGSARLSAIRSHDSS